MASPHNAASQPAGAAGATASAVQLAAKQLGAAVDAFRAARASFASHVGELAAKEGFFPAASPAAQQLVGLLRPLVACEQSAGVQAAAASALARIMQAAAAGTAPADKKAARGRAWAECIVLGAAGAAEQEPAARATVEALVGIVAGSPPPADADAAKKLGRGHLEDHATTAKYLRRASLLLLRHLAAHPSVLPTLLDAGLAAAVVKCLADEADKDVREQGAWCLGIVGRSGKEFAQHVAAAGAFPVLVECLREPELSVRKTACAAAADIVKWDPELASQLLSLPSLPLLASLLRSPSPPLRTASLSLLTHIARHPPLAERTVLHPGVAKAAVMGLHPSRGGRERWAGVCWCAEVARGGEALGKLLVDAGAGPLLVAFLGQPPELAVVPASSGAEGKADPAVPAIAALGHVAGYSALLAHACIGAGAVPALAAVLDPSADRTPAARESAAWAAGQIAKWSPLHAAEAASHAVPERLLAHAFGASDPAASAHKFLKSFLKAARALDQLPALVSSALALPSPPLPIGSPAAALIAQRLLPLLSSSLAARKELVRTGALGRLLEWDQAGAVDHPGWTEAMRGIRGCFPPEVISYYTPGYGASLLTRMEEQAGGRAATPKGVQTGGSLDEVRREAAKIEAEVVQTPKDLSRAQSEARVSKPGSIAQLGTAPGAAIARAPGTVAIAKADSITLTKGASTTLVKTSSIAVETPGTAIAPPADLPPLPAQIAAAPALLPNQSAFTAGSKDHLQTKAPQREPESPTTAVEGVRGTPGSSVEGSMERLVGSRPSTAPRQASTPPSTRTSRPASAAPPTASRPPPAAPPSASRPGTGVRTPPPDPEEGIGAFTASMLSIVPSSRAAQAGSVEYLGPKEEARMARPPSGTSLAPSLPPAAAGAYGDEGEMTASQLVAAEVGKVQEEEEEDGEEATPIAGKPGPEIAREQEPEIALGTPTAAEMAGTVEALAGGESALALALAAASSRPRTTDPLPEADPTETGQPNEPLPPSPDRPFALARDSQIRLEVPAGLAEQVEADIARSMEGMDRAAVPLEPIAPPEIPTDEQQQQQQQEDEGDEDEYQSSVDYSEAREGSGYADSEDGLWDDGEEIEVGEGEQ